MKMPPGYKEVLKDLGELFKDILEEINDDAICELLKTIYRIVQAALMWYKKTASILVEKLYFKKNRKDSCLFYKKDENRQIIIFFCVYNSAMMGEAEL